MQTISSKCPSCGGVYSGNLTSRFMTCEYCGTRFALSSEELKAIGFVDRDGDGFDDRDSPLGRWAAEDDANNEPMYAFARDVCDEFLSSGVNRDSFKPTDKIIRGLGLGDDDELYLVHDDTLFKSGKNGFAITSRGLYCREMGESAAHFVSWDDFARRGRPGLEGASFYQDGVSICYFTDNSEVREGALAPLFERLYAHARKVM